MRNIKLNKTYITTFGKEFTPIEKLPSNKKINSRVGNQNSVFINEESRYINKTGNIIRKSKLWYIKGKTPPNKPISTI